MRATGTNHLPLTILQIALCAFFAGRSLPAETEPIVDPDDDWPFTIEASGETTVRGNPLDDGDNVYSVRISHRFFSGSLGLEGGLGVAEPTSANVRSLGREAELLLLDFSLVWYANYSSQERIFLNGSSIKPELIIFAGPGLASLKIDDGFAGSSVTSEVFLTLNAGIGAKLYWFQTDEDKNWNRRTSRWYVRPELRARWFHGEGGEVDLTAGLALGYSFGNRSTWRALGLKTQVACQFILNDFIRNQVKPFLDKGQPPNFPQTSQLQSQIEEYRTGMAQYRAEVTRCGSRCLHMLECINQAIDALNDALSDLNEMFRDGVANEN